MSPLAFAFGSRSRLRPPSVCESLEEASASAVYAEQELMRDVPGDEDDDDMSKYIPESVIIFVFAFGCALLIINKLS